MSWVCSWNPSKRTHRPSSYGCFLPGSMSLKNTLGVEYSNSKSLWSSSLSQESFTCQYRIFNRATILPWYLILVAFVRRSQSDSLRSPGQTLRTPLMILRLLVSTHTASSRSGIGSECLISIAVCAIETTGWLSKDFGDLSLVNWQCFNNGSLRWVSFWQVWVV